jgi:hypothetical protein
MAWNSVFLAALLLIPSAALWTESAGDSRQTASGGEAGDHLAAYSRASSEWGNGIEAIIEEAFRSCFRTFIIDGKVMTLNMPFGENNERSELSESELAILGGGKADPLLLWDQITTLIESADFRAYVSALSEGRTKVVIFDLAGRAWSTTSDRFTIDRISTGAYPGLPHTPFVLSKGRGATPPDVYNYLYGVGRVGMDCSGFVWYVLKSIAAKGRIDLDRVLGRTAGSPRAKSAPLYVGTQFFDPRNKYMTQVKDEIRLLKPGDIILFRGDDGSTRHSAIIQSIDRVTGIIRYLQSTDEAPQADRGVHESIISFDPSRQESSLKDPSVIWRQRRLAPFDGETSVYYHDDGERYRAYPEHGGGTVVRLKALQKLISRLSSDKRS